jgi:molybdenum cofactor cytidylyltransferase
MHKTGTVILAAGSSSRLGHTKQLLSFKGKTLLQHVIDEATNAGASPIVVVLGSKADEISKTINRDNVELFFNEHWEQGMASGIAGGVDKAIALDGNIEQLIVAVCDQPFISASSFKQLYATQKKSNQHIVASAYADTIGTPDLFTKKYFTDLLKLTGEEGAKKIVISNLEDVATIELPQGAVDIDTIEDYDEIVNVE